MKIPFKTFSYLILVNFICNDLSAQNTSRPPNIKKQTIGITPTAEHREISGLAIGLTAHPWSTWTDTTYMRVNGLNIELGPLGIIGGVWGTLLGLFGNKDSAGHHYNLFSKYGYEDSSFVTYPKYGTHINGLSLSLGGTEETFNSGLIINGLSGFVYKVNGVQISGLINNSYQFNGLMIAGISNRTTKGNGIQIGIINNARSGRLLQLGLFNRIGNRVLPFVNFNLKRDT